MNSEPVKMEIINESPKINSPKVDSEALEYIFGKTDSSIKPNGTLLDSERNHTNATGPGSHDGSQTTPLLEPDRDKSKIPLADPEVDDVDADVANHNHFPAIDEDLDEDGVRKTDIDLGDLSFGDGETKPEMPTDADGKELETQDGKWPWPERDEPDYPYDNGLTPRFGEGRPVSPMPSVGGFTVRSIDVNTYQQKKNLAQGMMDLALLSANANQLRYVIESVNHPYYYTSVTFIALSIIFQIAVGIGLIMNSRYDVNVTDDGHKADKINNFTVLGIFLITIVNVFITSFGVGVPVTPATAT